VETKIKVKVKVKVKVKGFRPASLRARCFCQTIQKYPKDLTPETSPASPVPCVSRS